MRHLLFRSLLLTPVFALIAFAQGAVSPALGACSVPVSTCGGTTSPCSCGDLVVIDTKLDASHPVLRTACPDDGLFVDSGVTLQISGTIRHLPGKPADNCSGIVVGVPGATGATRVVVKIGTIVGFDSGVEAGDFNDTSGGGKVTESQFLRLQIVDSADTGIGLTGDNNVIKQNIITSNIPGGQAGILVRDGSQNTVSLNRTETGTDGIKLQGGSGNIVSQNLAVRSGALSSGFLIGGDCATVHSNQSLDNTAHGFGITGKNHTVTNNVANRNEAFGITTDPALDGASCMDCRFALNKCAGNNALPSGPGQSSPPGLCNAPPMGMVLPGAC